MFFKNRILMEEAADGKGAGGGAPDLSKENESLKAQLAELSKKLEGQKPPKEDEDLASKAAKEREAKEKQQGQTKELEKAIRFNVGAPDFVKNNATLLPKTIDGIIAQAEKENYGSALEKSNAIKVGLVSEFFAVQSNLDLLTETQKNSLAEFKGLTKDIKQERIQAIFDNIFEPTFEALKRIKKAEQLRNGLQESSGPEEAYKKKMQERSSKFYLGGKHGS